MTGSRYCEGGSSDYRGYRNFISRLGNLAARLALGVQLKESTTYFRVFDVDMLWDLPLRKVKAAGFSYGLQLVHVLHQAGIDLIEVPIHFRDRAAGSSKIPSFQIMLSAIDLVILLAQRLFGCRDLEPDWFIADACACCGDRVLAMMDFENRKNASYVCLRCGSKQVPTEKIPLNVAKQRRMSRAIA